MRDAGSVVIRSLLPLPLRTGPHGKVNVLDPKTQALGNSQPGSVQKLRGKLMDAGHERDDLSGLLSCENDRNFDASGRTFGIYRLVKRVLKYMFVKKNKGIHCLVLS